MFFGMTNSSATFQGMMNEILRNMINEGKVIAFVDDVLIGTETEEGIMNRDIRTFLFSFFSIFTFYF